MNLSFIVSILFGVALLLPMTTEATELVDSLDKRFKATGYPETVEIVRISIVTEVKEFSGERLKVSYLQALKIHRKLLSVMHKKGWKKADLMEAEVIDVGTIALDIDQGMNLKFKNTLRLKAYLYQCDSPMRKYRGGDIERFFQDQVVDKSEQCFTYEEQLQGKNYPYQ